LLSISCRYLSVDFITVSDQSPCDTSSVYTVLSSKVSISKSFGCLFKIGLAQEIS
jgi:hypothetical protein